MQKTKRSTKFLVFGALIAALYTALCIALAPISFGLVQFRVAEALTILPAFHIVGVWGVTLGCALSNLIGFFMGTNIIGLMDVLFGTAATLIAALLSYRLRGIRLFGLPVPATLPPVVVNALVIGAEITVTMTSPEAFWSLFWINALYIFVEQLIPCIVFGLALYAVLDRSGAAKVCFDRV